MLSVSHISPFGEWITVAPMKQVFACNLPVAFFFANYVNFSSVVKVVFMDTMHFKIRVKTDFFSALGFKIKAIC